MRCRIPFAAAFSATTLIALGGCRVMSADAASETESDGVMSAVTPDAMPDDFSLELVVQSGRRPGGLNDTFRWSYILFADGSLHAGESTPWMPPPEVRTLSQRQMVDLFETVQRLGLVDDPKNAPARNLGELDPAAGETLIGLTVAGHDARWTFIEPPATERGVALTALEDDMAALAWIVSPQRVETVVVPRRYDLGPDPYARFR
jgi:hypothetical protein